MLKYKNYIFAIIVIIGLIFAYNFVKNELSTVIQNGMVNAVQNNLSVQYNDLAKKLEVQGQRLDSNGTYLAQVQYLSDPGFFTKLFSKEAREQAKFRDKILSSIPDVVKESFKKYDQKPAEVGVTQVLLDSAYFEVRVGNSVKFARGALTYRVGPDTIPYYSLELYADTLEIQDVRSTPQEDGTLLSIVTAKSKLTGKQYNATSNRYILEWGQSPWDLRPTVGIESGAKFKYEGGVVPDIEGNVSWIKYDNDKWIWNVLKGIATPDGLSVRTSVQYRLFK